MNILANTILGSKDMTDAQEAIKNAMRNITESYCKDNKLEVLKTVGETNVYTLARKKVKGNIYNLYLFKLDSVGKNSFISYMLPNIDSKSDEYKKVVNKDPKDFYLATGVQKVTGRLTVNFK